MKKCVLGLAALAAIGFAGAAYAGDATAPKAMSDSEMDKVTAGSVVTGTPSTRLVVDNGQTTRVVIAGKFSISNLNGPGAFTLGTSGNGSVSTRAGGGLVLTGGPGGFGRAITPSGIHGGASP
jgi:hypothetical protein